MKTVIISGASKGIGAAIAQRFAKSSCNIVISYNRDDEAAKQIALECKKSGVDTLLFKGDVSQDKICRDLVETAYGRFGSIDYLINNAAQTKFAHPKNLDELNSEDFLSVYQVNLIAAYQLMRAVKNYMCENEDGGAIVNISSTAATTGIGSSYAYTASKGALNSLSLSLARVFAPKVRINVVSPGYVPTSWWYQQFDQEKFDDFLQRQKDKSILNRVTLAEEVADTVYSVAQNKALVGCVLTLDSGISLKI